jgi:hypothetical protein
VDAGLILSGVVGLIAGGVGSLVAPWVHWGLEKRREKLRRRRALIDNTRAFFSGPVLTRKNYRDSFVCTAIRPYLSKEVRDNIGAHNTTGGEQLIKERVLQELMALERKWKLI